MFKTTVGTLIGFTCEKNNLFTTLLLAANGDETTMQQSTHRLTFIDRSPTHFAIILDYMRSGLLDSTWRRTVGTERLLLEFAYFGISLPDELTHYNYPFDQKKVASASKEILESPLVSVGSLVVLLNALAIGSHCRFIVRDTVYDCYGSDNEHTNRSNDVVFFIDSMERTVNRKLLDQTEIF